MGVSMPSLPDDFESLLLKQLSVERLSHESRRVFNQFWTDPRRQKELEPSVYNSICEYLKNPTRVGIWRFQATWLPTGGISKAILDEIEPRIERDDEIEFQYGKQSVRIQLKARQAEIYLRVKNRISFIFELFKYMRRLENQSHDIGDVVSPDYNYIYEALDLDRLRQEFQNAYAYFVDKIDTPSLDTTVKKHELTRIKDGDFLLASAVDDGLIRCFAISPDVIENLQTFLHLAGKTAGSQLRMIFSPEEEVFEPYFPFVRLTYKAFDPDGRLRSLYDRAFEEYEHGRFESCINALGLIAEDYLTQIYETLFRDVAPKGSTLGQLYDTLNSEVKALYKKVPPQSANLDEIYKEITVAMTNAGTDLTEDVKRLLGLVRTLVNAIRAERVCAQSSIKELQNRDKNTNISIIPSYLRAIINELIRNRNAAAHKTRIPLGNYEALRTMYSLVALVMWWQGELALINWRSDKDTIIGALVAKQAQ